MQKTKPNNERKYFMIQISAADKQQLKKAAEMIGENMSVVARMAIKQKVAQILEREAQSDQAVLV